MDGEDRLRAMWRNLKQRLGFTGLACCGSSWNLRVSDVTMREEEEETEQAQQIQAQIFGEEPMIATHPGNVNLATALAAERRYRSVDATAQLKTLMRLFEETDGRDEKKSLKWYIKEEGRGGIDEMCCVCMERNKGAAFIPCGHTYCRVCSRELWLNRGLCPLCNCSIKEILNIF